MELSVSLRHSSSNFSTEITHNNRKQHGITYSDKIAIKKPSKEYKICL